MSGDYEHSLLPPLDLTLTLKQQKRIERQAATILTHNVQDYATEYAEEDLLFVRRLSECIKNREGIFLSESEKQTLARLRKLIQKGNTDEAGV